jgi:hypothetical protein
MYGVSPSFWMRGLFKTSFVSILSEVTYERNRAYCLMDWKLISDLAITLKWNT